MKNSDYVQIVFLLPYDKQHFRFEDLLKLCPLYFLLLCHSYQGENGCQTDFNCPSPASYTPDFHSFDVLSEANLIHYIGFMLSPYWNLVLNFR